VTARPLPAKTRARTKPGAKTAPPYGAHRIPEALDRLIEHDTALNEPGGVRKWRAGRAKDTNAPPEKGPDRRRPLHARTPRRVMSRMRPPRHQARIEPSSLSMPRLSG